jgi:hypothetical protein
VRFGAARPASSSTSKEQAMSNDAEDTNKLLKEIRDLQRDSLDRQNRFLWILLPIFAVLCIQTAFFLTRW